MNAANTNVSLVGAVFDLYQVVKGVRVEPAMITSLTSREDGLLEKDGTVAFELPLGIYHLVETAAPPGFQLKPDPVVIYILDAEPPNSVAYDDGTALSRGTSGRSYNDMSGVYTLKISNVCGYELPSTGGIGALPFRLGGGLLLTTGLLYRTRRRRRKGGVT